MKKIALLVSGILLLVSCTENQRARQWGGTSKIELKAGQALINATWKETDLWLLTTTRPDSIQPKTYHFQEDSSYGVMEGTIIIQEQ